MEKGHRVAECEFEKLAIEGGCWVSFGTWEAPLVFFERQGGEEWIGGQAEAG
jgi:hypothetical protein